MLIDRAEWTFFQLSDADTTGYHIFNEKWTRIARSWHTGT